MVEMERPVRIGLLQHSTETWVYILVMKVNPYS